jgi:hypothetical protein
VSAERSLCAPLLLVPPIVVSGVQRRAGILWMSVALYVLPVFHLLCEY